MLKSILPNSFKLNKQVYIVGNKLLNISFYLYLILTWILIILWVYCNNGYIKTDNYVLSTVVFQTFEPIETNYSKDEFNHFVKESEFSLYNKYWGSTDFVDFYPNVIYFMTNMVITPNQTEGFCPDNPYEEVENMRSASCYPENNQCTKGSLSKNGIRTGNCTKSDFPYDPNDPKHNYACQVKGWCPVNRSLFPLKNSKPVLIDTINSSLIISNTIEFPNENIIINNDIGPCYNDTIINPLCPQFKLADIIKRIPNAKFNYYELAQFGGNIIIKIKWDCYLPLIKQFECKPEYSFRRVDGWGRLSNVVYYVKTIYDTQGHSRGLIKSAKIKFEVRVKGSISKFDLFLFVTTCGAYAGIFSLMLSVFVFCVRLKYEKQIMADIVNVGTYQAITVEKESINSQYISKKQLNRIAQNKREGYNYCHECGKSRLLDSNNERTPLFASNKH